MTAGFPTIWFYTTTARPVQWWCFAPSPHYKNVFNILAFNTSTFLVLPDPSRWFLWKCVWMSCIIKPRSVSPQWSYLITLLANNPFRSYHRSINNNDQWLLLKMNNKVSATSYIQWKNHCIFRYKNIVFFSYKNMNPFKC